MSMSGSNLLEEKRQERLAKIGAIPECGALRAS
jgi:hypothetical protein